MYIPPGSAALFLPCNGPTLRGVCGMLRHFGDGQQSKLRCICRSLHALHCTIADGWLKLKTKVLPEQQGPIRRRWSPLALSQTPAAKLQVYGHGLVCCMECLFSSQLALIPIYTAWWTETQVCEQLAQGCTWSGAAGTRTSVAGPTP